MATSADRRVAGQPALRTAGLSKSFGGVHAVREVWLSVEAGEVKGVIGPNGAGKTALVNTISGREKPSRGSVFLHGRDVTGRPPHHLSRSGLTRSYQHSNVFAEATVEENLARADAFAGRRAADVDSYISAAGLDEVWDARADSLPYGQRKMLGLVMALRTGPSVLLLDEPAAGLESSERPRIDHIVKRCSDEGVAVLIVEHDMDLIRRLCPTILVLDSGRVLAEGETGEVLARADVLEAYLGTSASGAGLETGDEAKGAHTGE